MFSRILLANDPANDAKGENAIRLTDLFTLSQEIDAQLVVLGSCQSGKGEYLNGESVAGLAYGFSYVGVPGVVYSLWAVDETATNQLLFQFYKELASGANKANALHRAKQHFLANASPEKADPFYWAGFLYSGPITGFEQIAPTKNIRWPLALLLFVLLVIAGIIYSQKTKTRASSDH